MSDKQRQADELEVLKSIYETDLEILSRWPSSGCLRISPDPVNDEIDMIVVNVINEQSIEKTIKLKYLASIELYFECPIDYPSKSQPLFMLKCVWLSEQSLSAICRDFDEIWDRTHSEILFDWAYSLKDCCSFLKIEKLSFSVLVNGSNPYPSQLRFFEQKANLRLKELNNKILDRKDPRKSRHEENFCRTRERKSRDNIKYETPKENFDTQNKADFDQRTCGDNSANDIYSAQESPLTPDFIFSKLTTYGVRRKTIFKDCDSRVIPNYEDIKPNEHGSRGVSLIVQTMIDFNDKCISKAFRHESHFCGVCLELKKGSASVRVQLCGHIFCRECISQYLSINITEGNLRTLKCPNVDCGTLFTVAEIRQIVDDTIFKKFTEFSRKIIVEEDPNLLYCPRELCQSVARRCLELGEELGHCSRCFFYFCVFCKKASHGVQPCNLYNEDKQEVIKEYLDGDHDRRMELEKRYTKSQITKWVDEHLTSKYVQEYSRPCPNCNAPIQKNDGCNKMLCLNCNIPFCWLCNKCLSSVKPYFHFSNKQSPCYNKLFPSEAEFEDFDFENLLEEEEVLW